MSVSLVALQNFGAGPRPIVLTQCMTPYAKLGNKAALNFGLTSSFSISHWTKVVSNNSSLNAGSVFGNVDNSNGYGWDTFNAAGLNGDTSLGWQPRLSFDNNGATSLVGVETVNTFSGGGWHHTACIFNGTNSFPTAVTIYVDGVPRAVQNAHDATMIGDFNGTGSSNIGTRNNGAGVARPFNGRISLVSVFNIALTQSQVSLLYSGGIAIDVSSLAFYSDCVVWFPIGYGADTTGTLVDLKNGYNATGTGVTFVADHP